MLKEKSSVACHLKSFVSEFGNIFTMDGKVFFRTLAILKFLVIHFFVTQHIANEKHPKIVDRKENNKNIQQLITQDSSKKSSFNND